MIIDIIFINAVLWSLLTVGRKSSKGYLYKIFAFLVAIAIAISYNGNIISLNQSQVVANIIKKDYIIPVYESNKRDYQMTKSFVEELPVTTEIQNKVIKSYYSNNIEYVSSELIAVSGEVVTKVMEMLLIFIIVLTFLNGIGLLLFQKDKGIKKLHINKGIITLLNMVGNIVVISVFLVLINLMGNFLLLDLPIIDLESSIFKPIIYEIIDIFIRLM